MLRQEPVPCSLCRHSGSMPSLLGNVRPLKLLLVASGPKRLKTEVISIIGAHSNSLSPQVQNLNRIYGPGSTEIMGIIKTRELRTRREIMMTFVSAAACVFWQCSSEATLTNQVLLLMPNPLPYPVSYVFGGRIGR